MAKKIDNNLYHLVDLECTDGIGKTLYFTSLVKAADYLGIMRNQLDYAIYKNAGIWNKRWKITLEDAAEVPYKYINNVRI